MDQVVAVLGPVPARGFVADVVGPGRRPWRENRDVGAALALQFQLCAFETFSNLIVRDVDFAFRWNSRLVAECRNLVVAIRLQFFGCSCVVAVAIDDHEAVSPSGRSKTKDANTSFSGP